ncbi:hypothetical protein Kpol_1002p98 [Vanderwaltozyma polyspora DSM 70294]|uniref:SWR1-complex protein 5 n=1 Tax=Vanderwaltozyma polyspora (strain ATCC 22028 / DSM 70294 / BCRC 21397 / CBS 2163 / NBRC 10782 / NRRL Y-8283 / UCD 57-17) TaxID=436907 RepID=A7TEC8_VANPO|nr:uncharacterized protein Kpol_1002p98 [Vanderwaltozyma polyspora DSM 70294]EDO19450.1 hypothetical protein Kpol_1002p98 [Vanderwaltozyma polyspora DSM 70294]
MVEEHNIPNVEEEHDSSYDEEDDEDFDPTKVEVVGNSDEDEDDLDGYRDGEVPKDVSKSKRDYSAIESDAGGLIKTRRARLLEESLSKTHKYEHLETSNVSESIRSVWDDLKNTSLQRLDMNRRNDTIMGESSKKENAALDEETIWIERSYKFAGQVVNERKKVLKSSAEAKEYLNSLKFQKQPDSVKKAEPKSTDVKNIEQTKTKSKSDEILKLNLRRPLKRPPILEQIIAGSLKPKLTTLEKSKLDWATFVDKEGITDELQSHNKDGYLAKQDFLSRVESVKDEKYKDFRKKQLALRFQEQNQ